MQDIQVISLTRDKLKEALEQNLYWKDPLVPMPKSKVLWLLSSPRIKAEDCCAVITLEGGKMISFIYLVPDLLNLKTLAPQKVFWMVLWWVHPKYKNSVVGSYTFYEALRVTNNKIIIKSYAEHIAEFYKKQPFSIIASRLRFTIFFSPDPSMLIGKFNFLKPFKFVLQKLDYLMASVVNKINYNKLKSRTKPLIYEYINELDEKTWQFIKPLCKNDLIVKTKNYINWQIDNKQYTQVVTPLKQLNKSLIAGSSLNIHAHHLTIIKNEKIIGFLSYVVNFSEFNIRYFLVNAEKNYNLCVDALLENFINNKARFIFTDDTKLAACIKNRFVTIFTYKSNKIGLAHNSLKINLDNVNLYNRDGHFY